MGVEHSCHHIRSRDRELAGLVFELNKMATQTLLPLLVLLMIGSQPLQVLGSLYPVTGTTSPQSDDGSSPRISLSQPFQFFGRSHSSVYVNHNGDLTFTSAFSQYSPQNFPMRRMDIIAALWTDLDNRVTGSILYHEYTGGSILARATQDINTYFPGVQFTASSVFVATWYQVAYFPTTGTQATAQAILITNGRFSFVMLNYGPIAQTTRPIQAGYDTQDSAHHYSLEGSMTTNSSDPNSRFRIRSNVGVPSRWVFRTDRTSRGCDFNGFEVQVGDSFWSDNTCAEKCTCTSSGLQCVSQPCSFGQACRPSMFQFSCQTVQRETCTISGDPHYYTYDDTVFHFQGTCTYVLSEECGHNLPYFRVEGKNEHRGSTHVSWTRLVRVFVYDEMIELVKDQRGKALVNGTFVTAPFHLSNGSVYVYSSGRDVVVSTNFGLTVSYDAYSTVRIGVPNIYRNSTCGLCGNFNGISSDDFRTSDGRIVTSDVEFANSWLVPGDNERGCEVECSGLECAGCTEQQAAVFRNGDHCGILANTSGPFAACSRQLPPENFIQSCVYDLCIDNGYQPTLCQALEVYAGQCQQAGITVSNWRRRGFCEMPCVANSHFEPQGTGCPSTCVNTNSSNNCPLPSREGCFCNEGHVLSGEACVAVADCGCNFEGRYYSAGDTVILDDDCGRSCRCEQGVMTCQSHGCDALEACVVEEGERGCRPNGYATCLIRGPGSYQTFDDLTYEYPGACRLTLARVMGLFNHPHFTVTAEKVLRGDGGFDRWLKFESEGKLISLEMSSSSTVKVDGQMIRLPYSTESNRIQVYHSSIHGIVIRTAFGVKVQTVWPHFVSITAPSVYNGTLGGLCGNYNGHSHDEFRQPDGTLVDNAQAFGDSWRDGSLSAHCVETQHDNSNTNFNTSEYCAIIGSEEGPFTGCWSVEDPQQHMETCIRILGTSGNPASTRCEVLRDYALLCQREGVELQGWRDATNCEYTCPGNSHYEPCHRPCPSTCPSLSFPFTCETVCQEGCQCDDGFVLNGNHCVRPTSCGCHHNGRYRQSGEQFWDSEECQNLCTCNGRTGIVHCRTSSCEAQESCRVVGGELGCHPNPHGSCSAIGDPHYTSFDGKRFDFQGTCRYILATVCNNTGELESFSVGAKNDPWGGGSVSITAEVFVNVSGYQIHMSRHRRGAVMINGITANLPVVLNGTVSVFASGSRTFVQTDFGLSITYDGSHRATIAVPPAYRGKTCGLCGNFNQNQNDDFRLPSGAVVTSADEFGLSWKYWGDNTCTDGCGSSCPRCNDEGPARTSCNVIVATDGPFSFCHDEVDPTPYFNDCVFDVCVSGNRAHDILCRAIEAYVSACQSANVRILRWREIATCTITCPANSHYQLCGTDCGHTCASNVDDTCDQGCAEGCFCNEGFVRSGTECINVENCGCQYDGFYYNAGESFWTDGCTQRCECHAPNDLRCSSESCTPSQACIIRDGHLGCFDAMTTCTVWGDPHYISYDGAVAHFQGTCTYIVTESVHQEASDNWFRVEATNNHRGNNRVSFVSAVDVYLSNQMETTIVRIGANRVVSVNGSHVSLPVTVTALAQVQLQGSYVVVDAGDMIVQYDGVSNLLVRLTQDHRNRVTGMCGNFNIDPADDRMLPAGTLASSDNEFGQGWRAASSQTGCGSTDEPYDDDLSNCRFRDEFAAICSMITNTTGPFSDCHLHSDPQPFVTACVYDLCMYDTDHDRRFQTMHCRAIAAYEQTCSLLGLDIPEWRAAVHCAESDPCENLNCTDFEWCGEKDGVYGCFCDENHHRANNESYDFSLTCASSTGTMSMSRCQLFEAGFHSEALHLRDEECGGHLQDGRLVFHFDNDDNVCGTSLRSNGTHFIYENVIQGDVDPHEEVISRQRNIHLQFNCEYPLSQALSMSVGINPLESIINKRLPSGEGRYRVRMTPYEDASFTSPITGAENVEMEIDEVLYVEVATEGVDERQLSTIITACWATPVNVPDYPVRWDLIQNECPNPLDGTVEVIQNGVSSAARFSFRMFTFPNNTSVYLHCQIQLCLLRDNDCTPHCYPGPHRRERREASLDSATSLSVGPLQMSQNHRVRRSILSGAPSLMTSMTTLTVGLLTVGLLTLRALI